jgi:hypothetical protein
LLLRSFSLVDGIGRYEITVEIHDLQENQVIARSPAVQVDFPSRLHRVNLMIPLPPLPLQHPGAYDVVVFAGQHEIDRQQFSAASPPQPEEGDDPHAQDEGGPDEPD